MIDLLIRTDMQGMLPDLQRELGKTTVFVAHDLDEAGRLGDGIVIWRDGSIVQQGSGQAILVTPADDHTWRFVRNVNRGRSLRVDTFLDPPGKPGPPEIPSGMEPDAAVTLLSDKAATAAAVMGADRKPMGTVNLRQIIFAL